MRMRMDTADHLYTPPLADNAGTRQKFPSGTDGTSPSGTCAPLSEANWPMNHARLVSLHQTPVTVMGTGRRK